VKNTSTRTNVWEETGSLGNYGKTPSVSDLRTTVAYCESIPSSVPERLSTSTAFVKYLINQDGTVSTPNVTPFSLQLNQGNFQTGERVFLATQNEASQSTFQGPDYNTNYREIVRGATRIEPILYNQSGSSPAQWTSSIEFENRSSPAVGNYLYSGTAAGPGDINSTSTVAFVGDYTLFTINPSILTDNINFVEITSSLSVTRRSFDDNGASGGVNMELYVGTHSGAGYVSIANIFYHKDGWIPFGTGTARTIYLTASINPSQYSTFANTSIKLRTTFYNVPETAIFGFEDEEWRFNGYNWNTNQYPSPGALPSISITSSIWDPTIFPLGNGIKLSSGGSPLYSLYIQNQINPTWYFKNISNSGYGDVLTPWGIQRGDEFRFNNDPNQVYLVDYVVDTGSNIEIYFDRNVNTSFPLDINKYSITRYVDDASRIVIKGFRPNNTDGPYILRPEFVVPELDKGIDEFIVDLTQKGLL
jgi:hypothetical protein